MSDLSWHYTQVGSWFAIHDNTTYRIAITQAGHFRAVVAPFGNEAEVTHWLTFEQAMSWANSKRGES
jgi:hypothetical protein